MSDAKQLARDQARVGREMLDEAVLLLGRLPTSIDRAPLGEDLAAALDSLARWFGMELEHPDQFALLDAAIESVGRLRAACKGMAQGRAPGRLRKVLESVEHSLRLSRETAITWVVATQDRVVRAPGAKEQPLRPFQPSTQGIPELHALDPAPLTALIEMLSKRVSVPEDAEEPEEEEEEEEAPEEEPAQEWEDEPPEEEELQAEPPRRERVRLWIERESARTEQAWERAAIRRLARDCLEDIGIFATLRAPEPEEHWTVAEGFEHRLLFNLDALASLGRGGPGKDRDPGIATELFRWALEPHIPDRGRAFASAFVLGSLEGEEPLRALVLLLNDFHPSTYPAVEEALSLAPNPLIAVAMERLLEDSDPARIRLALRVLRFRRQASFGPVVALLHHPEPRVVEAAARCLAVTGEQGPAAVSLERLLETCYDDRACLAAAESLLLLRAPFGSLYLRRRLAQEIEIPGLASDEFVVQAIRLLALQGAGENTALIEAAVQRSPRGLPYLGWFGHPQVVESLLAALERAAAEPFGLSHHQHPATRITKALARILGPLPAALEQPPEIPTSGQAPAAISALFDPEAWRSFWTQTKDCLPPGQRARFGKSFHPLLSLEEVESEASASEDRTDAIFELALALGGALALEPMDWVARQRAEIARLRQSHPGT